MSAAERSRLRPAWDVVQHRFVCPGADTRRSVPNDVYDDGVVMKQLMF